MKKDSTITIQNKKAPSITEIGWYLTFGLIPFGSCIPGFLVLLISKIVTFFKRKPDNEPTLPEPRLVVWINRLFFVFLLSMVISALLSPRKDMALLQTFGFGLVIFVFIFGSQQLGRLEPSNSLLFKRYLPLLGIASLVSSIIALLRYFIMHMDRAENIPKGSINGLGTVLILVGGFVIGYCWWGNKKWRYFLLPYLGVTIAALLASKSRGAWLGFSGMLGCFGLFNKKFRIIFLVVIILVGIIFLSLPSLGGRFISAFSVSENLSRIQIWQSSMKMIQDYPIFGVGAGVYPLVYEEYLVPNAIYRQIAFAHNLYLQVLAEFGWAGLVIFGSILGIALSMSFSLARTGHPFYIGIFAAFIGVLIHQQVDLPIWGFDIGGAFWMLIGLTIGLYQYEWNKNKLNLSCKEN